MPTVTVSQGHVSAHLQLAVFVTWAGKVVAARCHAVNMNGDQDVDTTAHVQTKEIATGNILVRFVILLTDRRTGKADRQMNRSRQTDWFDYFIYTCSEKLQADLW